MRRHFALPAPARRPSEPEGARRPRGPDGAPPPVAYDEGALTRSPSDPPLELLPQAERRRHNQIGDSSSLPPSPTTAFRIACFTLGSRNFCARPIGRTSPSQFTTVTSLR